MKDTSNNRRGHFLYQLKWLAVYMTIGLVIIWIFTFPVDFVLLILVLVSINICRRRALLKKLGLLDETHVNGWRGLFKSLFQSPASSSMYGDSGGNNLVKYYCMSCGNEHNEIACPKCGSKMKRAG
jgi:hypothetical protein